MNRRCFLMILPGLALLSGCRGMQPQNQPRSGGSGSSTYTVRGQTYRPYDSANGYSEVGIASWYGPGFHGKTTANGERYNMDSLTAAHKLLPFNTEVRVTRLDNNRSIIVRINDRGPFVKDRIIDLSRAAARRLDMEISGIARVRVEAVNTRGREPLLTPQGDMLGKFYIQIGSFGVLANAQRLMVAASEMGFGGRVTYNENTELNYVQVGPFPSVDQAERVFIRLSPYYPDLFIIAE